MELGQMSLEYTPEVFVGSAKKGDIAVVNLFLAAGMDPNVTDKNGNTALMYEASKGHTEILDLLLKANADVNKENRGGATALSWAATAGKIDSLRILLDKGADAEAINKAFVSAACHGQVEVLQILFDKGAEVDKVGPDALRCAAGSTYVGVTEEEANGAVSFLLDIGVHVNEKSEDGWTALLKAMHRGRISVVRTLLDGGADVNVACDCPGFLGGGWTALMVAAREGHTEIVRALLEKGADVNHKNNKGETALMQAASRGRTEIVGVLLDKGADVNAQGVIKRRSALMMAVLGMAGSRISNDVVRVLLEYGADINMKDVDGKTAIELAEEELEGKRRAEIIRLLKQTGPK